MAYLSDVAWVHHGVPGGQHTSQRVADDGHLVDVEGIEETACAGGELLKAELIVLWLAGLAEANLVNGNDTVAMGCQLVDGFPPRRATEVLAARY